MISGSVAVEGQLARGLPQPFGPPMAEFLRPLPRAPPYVRYAPAPHTVTSHAAPSAAPSYPPVPGAYARFATHAPPFPPYPPYPPYHHHQAQPPSHPQPHPQQQPPIQPQPLQPQQRTPPAPPSPTRPSPRGKEGSLKHRLLARERATAPVKFSKGALIQLGGGELKPVEDMTIQDFILSAQCSPELRIEESTVVHLVRRPATDTVTLTLSYNQNRTQVEMETPVEHPFFVYGQGWASCSPERTLQCYGLQVSRLQVGNVCVSLTPREKQSYVQTTKPSHLPPSHHAVHHSTAGTVVTTATTTAMTVRPIEAPQRYPENLSVREDSRKRRSSITDINNEENAQRPKMLRH